jgi:hypothetical protein
MGIRIPLRAEPMSNSEPKHDDTTYFERAHVDQDLEGGRFAASVVAGESPAVQYPMLPPSSPWAGPVLPDEPPFGIDVNAMVPCGTPAEVDRSFASFGRGRGSDDGGCT